MVVEMWFFEGYTPFFFPRPSRLLHRSGFELASPLFFFFPFFPFELCWTALGLGRLGPWMQRRYTFFTVNKARDSAHCRQINMVLLLLFPLLIYDLCTCSSHSFSHFNKHIHSHINFNVASTFVPSIEDTQVAASGEQN